MKNAKALGLLVMAVVTGLAAAGYAARWITERGTLASSKVVVAAIDIDLGSKVNPQMLTTVDWPLGSVPPGAFSDPKLVEDRVVRVGLHRGEALLNAKLMPVGAQGGLSAVIAEGKRAMTVRVNDVVGVAGFALPGNYVDVMVNTQQDRARGEASLAISLTVLEQVLVLAVAQEAGRDETKPKVVSAVTLELSLAEAEKLDLARSVGTLSLVLRNQLDRQSVATRGITKQQLFAPTEAVAEAAPAAAPPPALRLARRPTPQAVSLPARECVEVIGHGNRALHCF